MARIKLANGNGTGQHIGQFHQIAAQECCKWRFDPGWYHGTAGDIERFRTDLSGEATGAGKC
jgi:hypothetical protein